jgi:O-acetyl-ADP-ribose deacetylase (regulator of RNase III)
MQSKIRVVQGDITKIQADAIVNAANSSLLGGGGVDGAIHRAGGKKILEECLKIRESQGGCPVGEAVITTAGNLPALKVIHTVGPVWQGGNQGEEGLLANAYRNSLKLAASHQLHSIAFPNISTGIYHFPKSLASGIAIATVKQFLKDPGPVQEVTFVCYDKENFQLYQDGLN